MWVVQNLNYKFIIKISKLVGLTNFHVIFPFQVVLPGKVVNVSCGVDHMAVVVKLALDLLAGPS